MSGVIKIEISATVEELKELLKSTASQGVTVINQALTEIINHQNQKNK